MRLPNLLIVGAAKSGTTSLHNYLNQHPDIFMCNPKEPHFLINKEIGDKRIPIGILDIEEYQNLFSCGSNCRYRGESSVMYLMYPEIVIPKVKKLLGERTKIIIMLRDPIERAYSGFHHVKRYNLKEDKTFEVAFEISEERYFTDKEMPPASRYKQLGLYYNQVQSYLEKMEDVHIIIYDDYQKDFRLEMKKVFAFLGVNPIEINSNERHMVGGWRWKNEKMKKFMMKENVFKSFIKVIIPFKKTRNRIRKIIQNKYTIRVPEMKSETRAMLKNFYKNDVKMLSELLDKNLNHWTK